MASQSNLPFFKRRVLPIGVQVFPLLRELTQDFDGTLAARTGSDESAIFSDNYIDIPESEAWTIMVRNPSIRSTLAIDLANANRLSSHTAYSTRSWQLDCRRPSWWGSNRHRGEDRTHRWT
jgi:hypothetical protein